MPITKTMCRKMKGELVPYSEYAPDKLWCAIFFDRDGTVDITQEGDHANVYIELQRGRVHFRKVAELRPSPDWRPTLRVKWGVAEGHIISSEVRDGWSVIPKGFTCYIPLEGAVDTEHYAEVVVCSPGKPRPTHYAEDVPRLRWE